MKTKIYVEKNNILAGITLKDSEAPEYNNMALHICENTSTIINNRQLLADALNTPLSHFVCPTQTHSANFYRVDSRDIGSGALELETAIKDTDAIYTFQPNIVLSSFSADCVPVLFYNEKNGLIGVIHSGWQGTVKEITFKLMMHLLLNEDCNPDDIHVQIGAALSQEKFEVDTDVYSQFKLLGYADDAMYFNSETNKYHIDNQQAVSKQCQLAGIPLENITIDKTCTFLSEDGFSYRQDRKAGRHLSFIVRQA